MNTLDLETRRRLYRLVLRHPGKYLRELQRESGLAMGALEYHLDRLQKADLVAVEDDGHKRFFPGQTPPRERRIMAMLRQRLPRRILVLCMQESPLLKTRIQERLQVARSTLDYHLDRLVDQGLLERKKSTKGVKLAIAQEAEVERLLVVYQASFLDRMVDAFLEGIDALQ